MGSTLFDQVQDLLGIEIISEIENEDSLSSLMMDSVEMDLMDDNQKIPTLSSNANNEYSSTHLDFDTAFKTNSAPESRERRKSRKQSFEVRAVSPLPKQSVSEKQKKCYERDPDDPQLTPSERKQIIKARKSKTFREQRKTGAEKMKHKVEQLTNKIKTLEDENRELRDMLYGLKIN